MILSYQVKEPLAGWVDNVNGPTGNMLMRSESKCRSLRIWCQMRSKFDGFKPNNLGTPPSLIGRLGDQRPMVNQWAEPIWAKDSQRLTVGREFELAILNH